MRNIMVNMADTGRGGKMQNKTRDMGELQKTSTGGSSSPIYAKPKKPSGGGSAPAPTQNRKGSPSTKPSIPRNPTRPGKGGFAGDSASAGRSKKVGGV